MKVQSTEPQGSFLDSGFGLQVVFEGFAGSLQFSVSRSKFGSAGLSAQSKKSKQQEKVHNEIPWLQVHILEAQASRNEFVQGTTAVLQLSLKES